jgi:hypothetical protein
MLLVMTRAGSSAARVVALVMTATVLVACGASPLSIGPSGIDGLTIPTPSPDPADFTDGVDNPWFPLVPGTVWTYRRDTTTRSDVVRAVVLPGSRDIDGVATTALQWQASGHGDRMPVVTRWYAEDRAGNVWWFGQEVRRPGLLVDPLARRSWLAGRDGAEPGLVLAARPRVGDGYANAIAPGVLERRSTVVSLTATVATPGQTYRDVLLTRDQGTQDPTLVEESFYVRGIGLVAEQTTRAAVTNLSLVRVRRV